MYFKYKKKVGSYKVYAFLKVALCVVFILNCRILRGKAQISADAKLQSRKTVIENILEVTTLFILQWY